MSCSLLDDTPPTFCELKEAPPPLHETQKCCRTRQCALKYFFFCVVSHLKDRLMLLISKNREDKAISKDCKYAKILMIFEKGERSICGSYGGNALLSNAGKIFLRFIMNRLMYLTEKHLPESQCGFRPLRGTLVMVFYVLQKNSEQQKH